MGIIRLRSGVRLSPHRITRSFCSFRLPCQPCRSHHTPFSRELPQQHACNVFGRRPADLRCTSPPPQVHRDDAAAHRILADVSLPVHLHVSAHRRSSAFFAISFPPIPGRHGRSWSESPPSVGPQRTARRLLLFVFRATVPIQRVG